MSTAFLTSAIERLFWGVGHGGKGKAVEVFCSEDFTCSKWLCSIQVSCKAGCGSREADPVHHTHSHSPLTVEDLCSPLCLCLLILSMAQTNFC